VCYIIILAFLHNAYITFLSWLAVLSYSINCQALVLAPLQISGCRTRGLDVFVCNSHLYYVLCGLEGFWWEHPKESYRLDDIGVYDKKLLKWVF
jgi:hypothetical protein